MEKHKITYWKDGEFWLGYLNDYPEYMTQGESFEDLVDHLKDINNYIPFLHLKKV